MSGDSNHDLLIKVSKDVEYIKINLAEVCEKIDKITAEVNEHDTWIAKHKLWHKMRGSQEVQTIDERRWFLPLFLTLIIFLTNLFLWGLEHFVL